jgi:hypothetical protein
MGDIQGERAKAGRFTLLKGVASSPLPWRGGVGDSLGSNQRIGIVLKSGGEIGEPGASAANAGQSRAKSLSHGGPSFVI